MGDLTSSNVLTTLYDNVIPMLLLTTVFYTLYGAIWRLYLSPISSFPGPRLAALTWWYQFYYDIYPHYGQYAYHIRELHKVYGPIIRINPFELHVADPDFFEVLYSAHQKRDKWAWLTHTFGMPTSTFATVEHAKHRVRRAALNPYFSATSVRRLQPVIDERVRVCLERIRGLGREGKVQSVALVASAFASDVIMTYAFGKSQNRLENPDFGAEVYEAGHEGGLLGPVMMHLKFILFTIQSLPNSVVKSLGPAMAAFVEMRQGFEKQVQQVLKEKDITHQDRSHPTVFHELLNSKLPQEDKSVDRLADEALSVVSAGNETVSWALTVATYHILASPNILRTLKTELEKAIPDPDADIPASKLEQLPYLNSIYRESLRLSYGMSCRLQRVPHEPLPFSASKEWPLPAGAKRDWIIPPGTPVSMTSILLHHEQTIFPNDKAFIPERWLENPKLWKYMVSFGAGSRVCLGQSLASSEMHLWLAAIFRRFGSKQVQFDGDEGYIELVETDVSDVEVAADRVIPAVKMGSKGVRIRVTLKN